MSEAKPFSISKMVVWKAYQKVKANKGTHGVDEETIEEFEKQLKNNLYKIWNRMSSGTYFPPAVKEVEIPKSDGKVRKLGIPTVSDRIAQMVVKMYLEPGIEPYFHKDSYGYRPGKSAIEAVGICRKRCWQYDWVIDIDIKGFFDNLDHDLLMRAVRKHTRDEWIIIHIERWLKASIQRKDGKMEKREKGTPQGGVISPLLSNLFLHYAFDEWMKRKYPNHLFERYADDIIVHTKTGNGAKQIKKAIEDRMHQCALELHPDKTKIVYCKDDIRKGKTENGKFDFLGYTFRTRLTRTKKGKFFVSFTPAISNKAAKRTRQTIRGWQLQSKTGQKIEEIAKQINPIVRGWINYYGKYYKTELINNVLRYLEHALLRWAKRKYKKFRSNKRRAIAWMQRIAEENRMLFAQWEFGSKPTAE